jgi:outer membrane murein-binding lipoprotein Lpp
MNPLAILALISELYEGTKNLRDELDAAREEIARLRTRLDELAGDAG